MKLLSCILILALAVLVSCQKKPSNSAKTPETIVLTIEDKKIVIPIEKEWLQSQDRIIEEVKPLWDSTSTGNSRSFSIIRVKPFSLGHEAEAAVDKAKYNGGMMFSMTISSPKWRFFRNRNGRHGLEQLDESGNAFSLREMGKESWEEIEEYLRGMLPRERFTSF